MAKTERPPRFVLRIDIERLAGDDTDRPCEAEILFESWDAAEVADRYAEIESLPIDQGRDRRQTPAVYYDVFMYAEDEQFSEGECDVCAIDLDECLVGSYMSLKEAKAVVKEIVTANRRLDNGR